MGGQSLGILFLYKVVRAEPHWGGGSKKKGKCGNDHATFNRDWWYVMAGAKRQGWRSLRKVDSAVRRKNKFSSRE